MIIISLCLSARTSFLTVALAGSYSFAQNRD